MTTTEPIINPVTLKPYTGKKKQVAELLRSRFGFQKISIRVEDQGFYNVVIDGPVFVPRKHTDAENAVRELLKDDPKFVGIDVYVN